MSSKVSCNLMVNEEDESSFLFAFESTGQLNRDVTVQNKMGNSFVAFALSTSEALDVAKQIQSQYMDYTESVVEKQRDESRKLKEQMSKLSVEGDDEGTAQNESTDETKEQEQPEANTEEADHESE